MDDNKNKDLALQEEQKAEEEALKEVKDDDLRIELAEEMGLDPDSDDNADLLDKVVQREKKNREKLSGAIKQKIGWRERAEKKFDGKDPGKGGETPKGDSDKDTKSTKEVFEEMMAERDLKDMDLPEEIKDEVRDLAEFKGISVKEAANHPLITKMVEDYEAEERVKAGTPKRGKKGSPNVKVDVSKPLNPDDFDFDTKEGVDAWNEAKKARAKYNAAHS